MAPDQEKAAKHWISGAHDAHDTAQKLLASQKYQHALFFCHLAVEKALKAKYIKVHNDLPPRTHDLVLLASQLDIKFNPLQIKELAELTTFNIEARYEEEKFALHQKATPAYTKEWLGKTSLILTSLL